MPRWPIERSWIVRSKDDARKEARSSDLLAYRACGMLGTAGLGKTYELNYLAELDRQRGLDVRTERLAVLGQTPDGLASQLSALAAETTTETVIYLDALDEVMVPVKTAGLILERWLRDKLTASRPALRISCRSAVWPPSVETAIREVYGEDECALALLQPLSTEDVRSIASARGVDADAFVTGVQAIGGLVLAQHSLTLEMLLRVYAEKGSLPSSRRELFAQGVELLAGERAERFDNGTAISIPVGDVIEAAERLACFSLLSGRDAVDLSDSASSLSLGRSDLGALRGGSRPLDDGLLRAVGRCGLCDADGPHRFRFGHRQFAEYLAGRRLARLLFHQARAALSSGEGWQAGAAGPLRETAAFAAMESPEIAAWVTESDPEVIGLSDVADDTLRRRATQNLLDRFRRHELTDSQIGHGGIELAGFQYPGAEQDLRPVLRERGTGCDDVLECAIELIESWNLSSMSDDLAGLVLDAGAPLQVRTAAGYALLNIGTPEARRRLLPLIADRPDDSEFDLKGLALQCNWPDALTSPELLAAITPPRATNYFGAYAHFLFSLDHAGFDARGHRLEGLLWAKQFVRRGGDYEATARIARRIAIASLDEMGEPGIVEALVDLLLAAANAHATSRLISLRPLSLDSDGAGTEPPVLAGRPQSRHSLIDALAARASEEHEFWRVARETPGLLAAEDFPWLMQRATDIAFTMPQRERYADLGRMLPWYESVAGVEAWLAAREIEPVASRLPGSLSTELGSEEAAKLRKAHAEMKRWQRAPRRKRLRPPPAERVAQVLALSETKDPRFFLNVCQDLTLEEYSTHYGFERFLTTTPGWSAADPDTRGRIVESAKRLLLADTDEPERGRTHPVNSILLGYMNAIWLVMERDPAWIHALPDEWWKRWALYMLRELRPAMSGEPQEPKEALLRMVHERAGAEVRGAVEELATSSVSETLHHVTSLLDVLCAITDADLDARLCECLTAGQIPEDRVRYVAQFVLARNSDSAIGACLSRIEPKAIAVGEAIAVEAAVALLHERGPESWSSVFPLLERRPDLRSRILKEFAHGRHFSAKGDKEQSGIARLGPKQAGQLIALLLEAFPPELDPVHDETSWGGRDDSARLLRDQLIGWLGDQKSIEAVEALRILEQRFGTQYPWLRRPRARAERSYRLSQWTPIPLPAVAELLAAADKRLIRSELDALEGVVAAVEQYAYRLRHDSPNDLEDLWNLPRKGRPTPKEEERVSDKLCMAIRDYFRDYAVTADREVQIFRRKLPRDVGGAPGSDLDVLCRVPAAGAANGDAIAVPIEVKLSHNAEARTGLRHQLVDRYMSELGTSFGVFVVAWMGVPKPLGRYRPLWDSPATARAELEQQANEAASSSDGLHVRVMVIDASLPVGSKSTKKKPASRVSRAKTKGNARGAPRAGKKLAKTVTKARPSSRARKRKPRRS